jgi:LysM repeat protein
MKKITESQLIEQARSLRAYISNSGLVREADTGMQAVGDDEGNTTITRPDGSTMVVGPDGKQIMPGSNPNLPSNKGVFNTIGNAIKGTGDFQKPTGFIPAAPAPAATPADPTKPVTTGDPAVTTGAAPAAPGTEAAKVQRFKELIAKASGPAGSAALDPAKGGSSATTIPSGPGTAVANESVDYFLNKLRLLESVQLNETLTPEEQAELDKLATELGSTEVPSPEIATLINQYNSLKKSAPATATATTPATTTPATNQAAKVPYKGSPGAQAIQKLNPSITDVNKIMPGQKIKLPNGTEYTIQKGDTLDGIAAKNGQSTTAQPKAGNSAKVPADAGKPAEKEVPPGFFDRLLGKVKPPPAPATTVTPATQGVQAPVVKKESVSYSEDPALARIIQLARK